MNTTAIKAQSNPRMAHQQILRFAEEKEMKTAKLTAKVNMWLHETFATKTRVRILGGLALGAMLITATAFAYQELNQGKAGSPPSIEQTEVWLPGDTYPVATADIPGFMQNEIRLQGDAYPVDAADLPGLIQNEVWLPGDTYPVATADIPGFMQNEIRLPGDAYPVDVADLPQFMQNEVWLPGDTYPASVMAENASIVEETVLPGRYHG
jgi:hypothetical protein